MLLCGFPACAFRAADRGCEVSTRPSLRPLGQEGEVTKQSSGEISREDAKLCLHRMRAGRVPLPPHPPSLRAQRSKPVCRRGGILDCFATLAMTMWRERTPDSTLVPRTQRSVPSTVRCRAGAHLPRTVPCRGWVPALRSNARALQRVRDTRGTESAL